MTTSRKIGCCYENKWKWFSALAGEKKKCNRGGLRVVLGNITVYVHSLMCAGTHTLCVSTFLSFAAGFLSSQETPLFSTYCRANIYLFSPDTRPAVCQMNHVCVFYGSVCFTLVSVYLGADWSAFICFLYGRPVSDMGDTSVAPGLADVCASAARMFTLNHVGSRQTPCCCRGYGLVPSRYWLLVELKAGEQLIKDTQVCVWCTTALAVVFIDYLA